MTKLHIFFTTLSVLIFTASTASAHPGSKILTAGSAKERTAMTPGMSFEEVGAVHVFRGREAIANTARASIDTEMHRSIIKIKIENRAYRSFRRLRTQGFYSGTGPKSRRYTQGFYSGD